MNFIRQYYNIKTLNLDHNCFNILPKEICELKKLQYLSLSYNRITTLSIEIGQLINLETLIIKNNAINYIHPSISKLVKLRILILTNNELHRFPREICKSTSNLQLLHIQDNVGIQYLPQEFCLLGKLTEFGFDWFLYTSNHLIEKSNENFDYIANIRTYCKSCKVNIDISFIDYFNWFNNQGLDSIANNLYTSGRTYLHLAAAWGHTGIIKQAAMLNKDLDKKDVFGETAFSLALKYNKLAVVRLMVDLGKVNPGMSCGKYGTVLHHLLIKGLYDLTERLIENYDIDINEVDSNGNTIFHYLLGKFELNTMSNIKIIKVLTGKYKCPINVKNNGEMTPLHCALRLNQTAAIEFVIEYNKNCLSLEEERFDFNMQGGSYGYSALHFAVLHMDIETVKLILENTNANVMLKDYSGHTPKYFAGALGMIKILWKYENAYINKFLKQSFGDSKKIKLITPKVSDTICISKAKEQFKFKVTSRNTKKNEFNGIVKNNKNFKSLKKLLVVKVNNLEYPPKRNKIKEQRLIESKKSYSSLLININNKIDDKIQGLSLMPIENIVISPFNEFAKCFKKIIGEETIRYEQYRLLYYMYKRYTPDTEAVLQAIINLEPTLYIIPDIIYLLSSIKSQKSLQLIKKQMECSGKLLKVERINYLMRYDKYPLNIKKFIS